MKNDIFVAIIISIIKSALHRPSISSLNREEFGRRLSELFGQKKTTLNRFDVLHHQHTISAKSSQISILIVFPCSSSQSIFLGRMEKSVDGVIYTGEESFSISIIKRYQQKIKSWELWQFCLNFQRIKPNVGISFCESIQNQRKTSSFSNHKINVRELDEEMLKNIGNQLSLTG